MPSIPTLLASVCLSGGVVAGLFMLADGSARLQLEMAMASSRTSPVEAKPATVTSRTKTGSLDRNRLTATIAGISQGNVE